MTPLQKIEHQVMQLNDHNFNHIKHHVENFLNDIWVAEGGDGQNGYVVEVQATFMGPDINTIKAQVIDYLENFHEPVYQHVFNQL